MLVLGTMATFGSYLGFQIRAGNGDMEFTGKTARKLHPMLMGLAFLFFFLVRSPCVCALWWVQCVRLGIGIQDAVTPNHDATISPNHRAARAASCS